MRLNGWLGCAPLVRADYCNYRCIFPASFSFVCVCVSSHHPCNKVSIISVLPTGIFRTTPPTTTEKNFSRNDISPITPNNIIYPTKPNGNRDLLPRLGIRVCHWLIYSYNFLLFFFLPLGSRLSPFFLFLFLFLLFRKARATKSTRWRYDALRFSCRRPFARYYLLLGQKGGSER